MIAHRIDFHGLDCPRASSRAARGNTDRIATTSAVVPSIVFMFRRIMFTIEALVEGMFSTLNRGAPQLNLL